MKSARGTCAKWSGTSAFVYTTLRNLRRSIDRSRALLKNAIVSPVQACGLRDD